MRLGVGLDLRPRDDVVLLGRGEGLPDLFTIEHANLLLDVDLGQGLLRRAHGGAHGPAGAVSSIDLGVDHRAAGMLKPTAHKRLMHERQPNTCSRRLQPHRSSADPEKFLKQQVPFLKFNMKSTLTIIFGIFLGHACSNFERVSKGPDSSSRSKS